ncbi:hypothetical protein [Thiobacillus sp.]
MAAIVFSGLAQAVKDLSFESADAVNEGQLQFLDTLPAQPIHHHQNRIRIGTDSLASGWVDLSQCHDHLDAVPSAQITFREGYVRDLKVDSFSHIQEAWIEGSSVQLRQVEPGARLCLSAQIRALRNTGNGYFNLINGPYMRKFLDGYYPMHVTLEVDYPAHALSLIDISPSVQPGLNVVEQPGSIRMKAVFEGELQTMIQFEQH